MSRQQSCIPLPLHHCGKSSPSQVKSLPHQLEFDLWYVWTTPWTGVGHCGSAVRQKVHQTVWCMHTRANRWQLPQYGRADPGAKITEDGNGTLQRTRRVYLHGLSSHHNTALKALASICRWVTQGDRVQVHSVGVIEKVHKDTERVQRMALFASCLDPRHKHMPFTIEKVCASILAQY